jgi:hypothetical protein
MSADKYQEKLKDLSEAVLKLKKVKIWVKDTPDNAGHLLNPYAILENATMLDFVYGYNEEQNRMLLTGVDAITKIQITDSTFQKPDNWSENVDTTKFKILS